MEIINEEIDHWKQMYSQEKETREKTESLLRNTMAFMQLMKNQLDGYRTRIDDLERKLDFWRTQNLKSESVFQEETLPQ